MNSFQGIALEEILLIYWQQITQWVNSWRFAKLNSRIAMVIWT